MSASKYPYAQPYREAVQQWAVSLGAKGSKLTVLIALLSFCSKETGQAFPGNKLIMERAGITSNDTRSRALNWLEQKGVIVKIAYETGGHGRAVVWGFGLPPWTTRKNLETFLKFGKVDESENLPENRSIPSRKSVDTFPKNGNPTKRTERTVDAARAGRPQHGDKALRADMSPEQVRLWVMTSDFKPLGTTFEAAKLEASKICHEMGKGASVVTMWGNPVPVEGCGNAHIAAE